MSYNVFNIEDNEPPETFLPLKHSKYFIRFLNLLPPRLASHDSTRSTIAFFSVCGLDLLNSLNLLKSKLRQDIINWTYGGLVQPNENEPPCGGFQGSRSVKIKSTNKQLQAISRNYQLGHVAITYTSLGVLITLGDDLTRLNRKSIVDGVAATQLSDGSFSACIDGSENDMRFVYCAAAICHMLDYWGDVDKEKMFHFIMNSMRFDNGFSQYLDGESHGGTTFCALAALQLSGQLNRLDMKTIEGIKRWLINRQVDGFQGRPNKPVDTCYSFWIGGALKILDAFELIDYEFNRRYIMETQDNIIGGFAKWPKSVTDPFHTYFGLCGLSFMGEPNINEVMPSLNISMRAYQQLLQLHHKWRVTNVENQFATTKLSPSKNGEESSPTSPLITAT